jgi:hypothetical protein
MKRTEDVKRKVVGVINFLWFILLEVIVYLFPWLEVLVYT